MSSSPRSHWGRMLGLALLFPCVLASGGDGVQIEAQAGPLYRVEGSLLSISCSVSGLPPPPGGRNNFEFKVRKPSKPDIPYQIISTESNDFSYAQYQHRVRRDEIVVEYDDPNSVVLKILKLEKTDEGEYECAVLNTRGTFVVKYNAKTTVRVIDNSLSVSSPAPASLTQTEGDSLDLTCEVSSNTIQHTHLSFAWFLRSNSESASRPLISMDRDFTLIPGQGFEERYKAGLIRLDKIGEVTYKLKMSHLKLSDQGVLYCKSEEWIQDPDRTWYSIATQTAGETNLTVKPKEVLTDSVSLVVTVSVPQSTLQEGQRLAVSCTVDTQNLKEKFFSLAWLRGGVELARVGPTGVLTVGPDYTSREREGELRAARIGDRDYSLILQPVRTSDQGEYVCRAWPEERSGTGDFTQRANQDSAPHTVTISATEIGLSVQMNNSVTVNEGKNLQLSCRVSGVTGQLSMTWQRQSASNAPFVSLISLNQDGVMAKAEGSLDVNVKALRPALDLFTLELEEVTQADAGVYQCLVSEWKTNNKDISQVATSTVTVTPLESFVKVSLTGRPNQAAEGQEVDLICRVRGLSLPRTLTWSIRRNSSTPDNILTLYPDGAISWFGGQQQRFQLKIEKKNPVQNEMWYHLIIASASQREAGNYQCSVSVELEKAPRKLSPSNEMAVRVERPKSALTLTSAPSIRADISADIELKCSVSSDSPMSRYAVTWSLEQQTENRMIVRSDQDAFLTFGPEVDASQKQRLGVSRTEGPNFILTIRNTRSSDRGVYICEVVQWQQDPSQVWHQSPPVSKSTQLTIIEPASGLHLNTTTPALNVNEGDSVELECNQISVLDSSSFFYKVVWLYSEHNTSPSKVPLVELDHTGLLTYPMHKDVQGLQERLRLERNTQSSFNLGIHMVHEEDSGVYVCRVEQYQLQQDGQWQQKASNETSPITLHVNVPGSHLLIANTATEFNISTSQSLTIPCNITAQSSTESEFQITWFWKKDDTAKQRPLLTAYRNATLQYWFGKSDEQLRFGHPLPNAFSLAVLNPRPEDSGMYFCEVEEWVPSLSHPRRKIGVERSGYVTAQVYTDGGEATAEPQCNSPTWIGAFFGVTFLLLLVIVLLVLKICRGNSGGKKKEASLWTENHQLNPKD